GTAAGSGKGITSISADPDIGALRLGGPGSGPYPFSGDLAELRIYSRQLTEAERRQVEKELHDTWLKPAAAKAPPADPLDYLYEEMVSVRSPFWVWAEE